MNALEKLTLSDVKSDTLNLDEYLKKYSNKTEIIRNHEKYNPRDDSLYKIKDILNEKDENINLIDN